MNRLILLLAGVMVIAGCATKPPATATYYDPITGRRTDLSENILQGPGTPREVVWFNLFRDYTNPRKATYYVEVKYMAPKDAGYLEIQPGDSLTVIADGQATKFDGSGSLNRRRTYRKDFVTETAIYEVSKADLQKLATAKQIKIQVKGNNGLVERDFTQENFENLRAFVTRAARA